MISESIEQLLWSILELITILLQKFYTTSPRGVNLLVVQRSQLERQHQSGQVSTKHKIRWINFNIGLSNQLPNLPMQSNTWKVVMNVNFHYIKSQAGEIFNSCRKNYNTKKYIAKVWIQQKILIANLFLLFLMFNRQFCQHFL